MGKKYSTIKLRKFKAMQDSNWYVPKGKPYANPTGLKRKFGRFRPKLFY